MVIIVPAGPREVRPPELAFEQAEGLVEAGVLQASVAEPGAAQVGAAEVINRLRPKLNRLTGASTFLQASQDLRIGGRGGNAMYQYTIQADNVNDLQTWGPRLLNAMQRLPGFQDVSSDQQNGGLDERLTFDRLDPYAGAWLNAAGEYTDADGKTRRVAVSIGSEHGTVGPEQVKEAAKEAVQGVGFDLLVV